LPSSASRTTLKNTQLAALWEALSSQRQLWLGLITLAALLIFVNYRVLVDLNVRWTSDPNYGHGILIPFIALYFIYVSRHRLRGLVPVHSWLGLVVFLFGMLLRYIAMPLASVVLEGIAMVVMANGLLMYVGGWQVYRALWFPALYLFFMIPLPEMVHTRLAFPLQLMASKVSAAILKFAFGVSLMLQGNVLVLASRQLSVEEACSGMRSILGLLALGVAFAYLAKRNFWEQAVLVISTIPIAISVNVLRIVVTALLHEWGYSTLAEGVYHTLTGWFVFMFALVMFLGVNWVLDRIWVDVPEKGEGA
jgi:exosortase